MRISRSRTPSRAALVAVLALSVALVPGCSDDPSPDSVETADPDGLDDEGFDGEFDDEAFDAPSPLEDEVRTPPPGGAAPIPSSRPAPPLQPKPEEELPPETAELDLDEMLERMQELYPRVLERPAATRWRDEPDMKEGLEKAKTFAEAKRNWKADVEELVLLARRYARATESGEGGAPVARYYEGFGRLELARLVGRNEAATHRDKTVTALEIYMDSTRPGEGYRADAANLLVQAYTFTSSLAPERADKAADLLPYVVTELSKLGRRDEAIVSIAYVCRPLLTRGREGGEVDALERLAAIAETLEFETADYGEASRRLKAMARATRVRPGVALDELPDVDAVDGKPLRLADLRGKPVVLHFFKTDLSERTREVEAHLRPIWDAYHAQGLELIGVSIDWEMTPEFLERRKREWERDEMDMSKLRDGKLESVTDWAEERGLEWRWYWDGKWLGNAVADHYGVPLNQAWSILIDAEGVIAWAGPPFKLKEQVEKLLAK